MRIDADVRVVERPEVDVRILADDVPRRTCIVRAPELAVVILRLADHVHGVGLAARDGDADPIQHLWNAVRQLLPVGAAVRGFVQRGLAVSDLEVSYLDT